MKIKTFKYPSLIPKLRTRTLVMDIDVVVTGKTIRSNWLVVMVWPSLPEYDGMFSYN